jgi:hypothetical protein
MLKMNMKSSKNAGLRTTVMEEAFPTVGLATAIEATVTAAQVTVMEAATVDMAASNHLELILQP